MEILNLEIEIIKYSYATISRIDYVFGDVFFMADYSSEDDVDNTLKANGIVTKSDGLPTGRYRVLDLEQFILAVTKEKVVMEMDCWSIQGGSTVYLIHKMKQTNFEEEGFLTKNHYRKLLKEQGIDIVQIWYQKIPSYYDYIHNVNNFILSVKNYYGAI